MRARGLKLLVVGIGIDAMVSRPMRARGLKQVDEAHPFYPRYVAPHAGAWIET